MNRKCGQTSRSGKAGSLKGKISELDFIMETLTQSFSPISHQLKTRMTIFWLQKTGSLLWFDHMDVEA